MFTSRARSMLALGITALAASLALRHESVAMASLTLVIWVALTWFNFRWRVFAVDRTLEDCRRSIGGVVRRVYTVTVDQDQIVRLTATVSARLSGLRLWIEDVVPAGCDVPGETPAVVVDAHAKQKLNLEYVLRATTTGKFTLPGIQISITDGQGLYRVQRFIPLESELVVLPFLIRPQTTVSTLKQKNVQLLAGHHRHLQPGMGGELLAIRDYQTGDPPKTIAWKASARLGRLLTCEYEGEVPVRANIVCDLSPYQFIGRPGPAAADRIMAVTASITRLMLSNRDPVACLLVNESNRSRVPHGQGERQLTRVLHTLLSCSASQAISKDVPLDDLLDATFTSCFQRYPELFDERVNPQPAWFSVKGLRRRFRQRWQLSFALAQFYRGGFGLPVRLVADDDELRHWCCRFLRDHPSAPRPVPTVPDFARVRQARKRAIETMCRAVLEGVSRAHDNELFVMVGAFPAEQDELDQLEQTLRVARAAYHRVVLVDVGQQQYEVTVSDPVAQRILAETRQHVLTGIGELKLRMTRLGVKIARVDSPQLTEEIASELELLKFGRARTGAASSW